MLTKTDLTDALSVSTRPPSAPVVAQAEATRAVAATTLLAVVVADTAVVVVVAMAVAAAADTAAAVATVSIGRALKSHKHY